MTEHDNGPFDGIALAVSGHPRRLSYQWVNEAQCLTSVQFSSVDDAWAFRRMLNDDRALMCERGPFGIAWRWIAAKPGTSDAIPRELCACCEDIVAGLESHLPSSSHRGILDVILERHPGKVDGANLDELRSDGVFSNLLCRCRRDNSGRRLVYDGLHWLRYRGRIRQVAELLDSIGYTVRKRMIETR